MRTTDVTQSFWYAGFMLWRDVQLVPRGTSCRLFSFEFKPHNNPDDSGYVSYKFRDGGSGGTARFEFGINVVDSTTQYNVPVVSIPSRGIRFDDGIFFEQGLDDESGVGGIVSFTATIQGATDSLRKIGTAP